MDYGAVLSPQWKCACDTVNKKRHSNKKEVKNKNDICKIQVFLVIFEHGTHDRQIVFLHQVNYPCIKMKKIFHGCTPFTFYILIFRTFVLAKTFHLCVSSIKNIQSIHTLYNKNKIRQGIKYSFSSFIRIIGLSCWQLKTGSPKTSSIFHTQ